MLIVCPSCTTAYRIELSTLGASGRSVRCARCRNVWFASVTDVAAVAMPPMAAAAPAENAGEIAVIERPLEGAPPPTPPPETVTVDDAPSLVPSIAQNSAAPDALAAQTGPDIETLAARRARASRKVRRRRLRMPSLPAVILILLAILATLINWRTTVVRYLPQTGSLFAAIGLPVNIRGLSFDNVTTSIESRDGVNVLSVQGTIANVAQRPLEVPRLRFAVRNPAGYEVYAWTAMPNQSVLAPGEATPFQARLASPPADGQQVIVRFFRTTEDR